MASNSPNQRDLHAQVLALLNEFSSYGQIGRGGISRVTGTAEEKKARDYLCRWLINHGLTVMIDPIGNIFGILAIGNDRNGRAFFCGSHLDSQPEAGKFDGALGVVYACVGAKFLTKLIENKEFAPAFDYFVVCCWTAEEGARFQPSLIGSRVFSGELSLEDAWKLEDSSLHVA